MLKTAADSDDLDDDDDDDDDDDNDDDVTIWVHVGFWPSDLKIKFGEKSGSFKGL